MLIPTLDTTVKDRDDQGERIRRFYEQSPAMMHAVDRDGVIELVSDRWLQRLGYTRDELVGRRATDFLSEESRREVVNYLEAFRRKDEVEDQE